MSFAPIDTPAAGAAPRMDAEWLDAHWMPYTANRQFKANPRMIVEASGAYFTDSEGRKIFDGLSGLWCSGLGHGRREIAEAIGRQAMKLDYAPAFQFGHPLSFELANRVKELTPAGLDYVFFTGSGSESADTSLKMARAYWRAKGQGTRTRLIAGRALDVLPRLSDAAYDLVFVDGDKTEYPAILAQAKRLLRVGGLAVFDNVLWSGRVADAGERDPETIALRDTAAAVRADDDWMPALLTIGDGLLVASLRDRH